jgi:hypothetical protein
MVLIKPRRVVSAIVLAASASLVVVPWIVRNRLTFKVARLSSVETINLTYYVAAGAYQLRYGLDMEQAQLRIAHDYQLTPPELTFNYQFTDKGFEGVAAIDRQQRQAAWAIFHDYPREIVHASLIGLAKASLVDTTSAFGYFSGRHFTHPQFSSLLQGRWTAAAHALRSNDPPLIGWFVWETLHAVLMTAAAGSAVIWSIFRRRCRRPVMVILAILSYQCLTVAMVGLNASARQRTSTVPFLAILAACTTVWIADALHRIGSVSHQRVNP